MRGYTYTNIEYTLLYTTIYYILLYIYTNATLCRSQLILKVFHSSKVVLLRMANSVLPEKIGRMGLFIRKHHNLPAVANSAPTSDL